MLNVELSEQIDCKNCGAPTRSKFCSECGQSTSVDIPSVSGLIREVFSAIASYDSRVWRTIVVLLSRPGELTVAYVEGVRARYLSPFQLFFWLQAITFLVNRKIFEDNIPVSDMKSRDLMLVGVGVTLALSVLYINKRRKFVEHLVFTTHLWSFMMIILLLEYGSLPFLARFIAAQAPSLRFRVGITATLIAVLVMVVYTPLALVKAYKDNFWLAMLRTLVLVVLWYGLTLLFQTFLHPGIYI